jgi:uncharacterized protein GlcG (DUF336 family)
MVRLSGTLLCCTVLAGAALAQAPAPPPPAAYGESLNLDMAKKVAAAAEAEAVRNRWTMAIVVVDAGNNLVLLQRMDQTQLGSIRLAEGKAHTALEFRRPSRFMQDAVTGGAVGNWWLGVVSLDGGVPILVGGKVVGAVGVSGGSAAQDAQTAQAGADALK